MQNQDPVGAIVEALKNDHNSCKRKKTTRFLNQLQRYTQWLQNFSQVVDVVVQTQAGVGCPIWAPIKFVLQVCTLICQFEASLKIRLQTSDYHKQVTDKVLDMIRIISDNLPRFELYEKLSSDAMLQTALLNVFTDIVSFCLTIFSHTRHRSLSEWAHRLILHR